MRFISASLTRSSSFYARISGSESGSLVSSSFIITTHKDLGGFDGDFTDGKVVFTVPSQSAGGSADVKALVISASGNNPRVGIGVDNPLKAFDFKEVSDTNRGGEILIRGSRTTKGAEPNDEVGRINFIIDSSSYLKVETSGSAAEIIAFADEVDESGIKGSLSFRVSAQKNEDSVERIRITPNETKVTGSLIVSSLNPLFPSFTNIGKTVFSGSVDITSSLEVDGAVIHNSTTTHFGNVVISNGSLDVNDDGVKIRGTAGLTIGDIIIPNEGELRVVNHSMLLGGVHVGGTSDPGTDNLLVDGTTTLVGTTIISGSTLNVPNLTAGSVGSDYDKLLIVDSSGQVRTLADNLVPFIEVFDGEVPTNQTLVMFSGSTGNIANATGVSYNSGFGWTFSGAGSVYDITVDDLLVSNDLTVIGDMSAANGSFSGDLTVNGNITANQYIVSSSVTYLTQSFSSGSTIFGDTLDDTHQFTGSVDITGSLGVIGTVGVGTDNPTYQLHVSSSTAALGVYERAGGAALYLEGQETRGVLGTVGSHPLLIAYNSGEVARFTGTSFLVTGSLDVSTSITASGNISASGEIETNTISTITTVIASDSATNVDTFNTSSYTGAIYDYTLVDTTVGARAGQFMIAQDNGSVTFTDNSTKHLFDVTAPEISGQINGANVEVQVTNGNGYTFKSFVKKL